MRCETKKFWPNVNIKKHEKLWGRPYEKECFFNGSKRDYVALVSVSYVPTPLTLSYLCSHYADFFML